VSNRIGGNVGLAILAQRCHIPFWGASCTVTVRPAPRNGRWA
jgi:hypothetical protein